MSAQATSFVWEYSPYRGSTFDVHKAIADSVNDQHSNQFWMFQDKLARKARVSRETGNRAVKRLIADGFLELVEEGGGRNRPSRFRFLFPKVPQMYDSTTPDGKPKTVTRDHSNPLETVTRDHSKTTETVISVDETVTRDHSQRTKENSKNLLNSSSARTREADDYAAFWKFWQVYPSRDGKKLGKGKAEAKFYKTPRRERDAIAVGVRNYRDAIDQGLAFGPKDAHRWLNDRDWLDWQTPAKPDPNRRRKTPNEQAFEEFSEDPDWRAAFDDLNGSGKAGAVSQGRLPEGSVEPGPDEGLHPGNGGLGRGGSSYGHSGMGKGPTTSALDRRYPT